MGKVSLYFNVFTPLSMNTFHSRFWVLLPSFIVFRLGKDITASIAASGAINKASKRKTN
jgi:hypothetical protein